MKRVKNLLSIFILFLLSLSFFLSGCRSHSEAGASNILILDSLLQHTDDFSLERLKRIAEIKHKRQHAQTISDKYFYDNLLFENFYTLSADSALYYADESIKSAEEAGNQEWIIHSLINKANLLTATGLLSSAQAIMKKINPNHLSKRELVEYYGQMVHLYSHLGNYTGGSQNHHYVTERLYKDSVMSVIEPDHPEYLWYKSWDIIGTTQNSDTVIEALRQKLSSSGLNEYQDAKDAYVLARLYEEKGDRKNYEEYMALSAIIDVKIANAEIASIEELANKIFEEGHGDIDRAYRYINYSLDKAISYPNRIRAFGIANTMEKINAAYQEGLQRQQKRTKVFLVLVCVLAGILFIAIIDIIFQNRKVNRQRKIVDQANDSLNQKVMELSEAEKRLNEMNTRLNELNQNLQDKNAELYESNFVKEEYIGYVFKLCSRYIAEIEDFKRNIYIKAVKKQWKEIENLTAGMDMKEELKDFYHSFDTIFLNLYPNFVNDFNSLLKPDKQITVKEGELLNMELRIYALIRLGITDSVKIADFLHCAPQTVYNYRLKTRGRSFYSKNDFLEQIKSIGHFQGK